MKPYRCERFREIEAKHNRAIEGHEQRAQSGERDCYVKACVTLAYRERTLKAHALSDHMRRCRLCR